MQTSVGGKAATVEIVWTSDKLIGVHAVNVGGGNWSYQTTVRYSSGKVDHFKPPLRPRAIWVLEGTTYVACADTGNWWLGRLEPSGHLKQITRSELPDGPREWNLDPSNPGFWSNEFGHAR